MTNIIVCVKQVLDPEILKFNIKSKTLEEHFYILNRYDKIAVEEALRVKEKFGETVTAVTLGSKEAEDVLKSCLIMGVDKAIHLYTEKTEFYNAYSTAKILATFIEKIPHDLIFCGHRSIDFDNRYVGIGIAEQLKLPIVSGITKLEISKEEKRAAVHRKIERGDREIVEVSIPAVFTVDETLAEQRYPSLPTVLEGLRKKIEKINVETIVSYEDVKPKVKVIEITQPKPRVKKEAIIDSSLSPSERIKMIVSGGLKEKTSKMLSEKTPEEVALEFVNFLKNTKVLDGK